MLCMPILYWVLTSFRALTGWGRHPMHSAWIGRSQTTTVRSPTCRCTWIEVFRQRQIFGVLMFGRSCTLYLIIFYTNNIHIDRERGRKRSTLFSWIFFRRAWSLPWFFGASIVQLRQRSRCRFRGCRSVHLAINFVNLASKPLVTPAVWIWHLDLRRASVLKMAETGSCAFSSTGQMSFCHTYYFFHYIIYVHNFCIPLPIFSIKWWYPE